MRRPPPAAPPLRAVAAALLVLVVTTTAGCEPEGGTPPSAAPSSTAAPSTTTTAPGTSPSGSSATGTPRPTSTSTAPGTTSTAPGTSSTGSSSTGGSPTGSGSAHRPPTSSAGSGGPGTSGAGGPATRRGRSYPLHTGIVATTFWVGEVFDPDAPDGSQVYSTYDDDWLASYGGCDGRVVAGRCSTERRTAANGWFPTRMTPKQNPFYLDLPFDDVNDASAAAQRARVVPWAHDPAYAAALADPDRSLMKDRWVAVRKGSATCYGQVQDAGPGEYDDVAYVFGSDDARPRNRRYHGAGMDVSPALNGCLGFAELDGEDDVVDWWFVDDVDVPAGPWLRLVTRS